MKKKIITIIILSLSFFIILFLSRMIFSSFNSSNTIQQFDFNQMTHQSANVDTYGQSKIKNYATKRLNKSTTTITQSIDQKYEKIAKINSTTAEFENDEKKIKSYIEQYNGLTQHEKNTGLPGSRYIELIVGIPPENFDKAVNTIKKIGNLKTIIINKIDKTNEFKKLNVSNNSLIKTRDALLTLKRRQASVEELINLENRILEIENRIQEIGVSIGEFDEVNEFCTVEFYLKEQIPVASVIPLLSTIKNSFTWTIKWYIIIHFTLIIVLIFAFILIVVFEKFKNTYVLITENKNQEIEKPVKNKKNKKSKT